MSGLALKSTFGTVTIDGLIDPQDLAAMFAGLFADEDVREALARARDATRDLEADPGRTAREEAQGRLDYALDTLAREIQAKGTAVRLEPQEARRLRELLIAARLGQGRADAWQAHRRIAS